ncbi:polymorphic toxin type 50 domain-containing protein [Haloimpatiens sp. FM7315]|uniref:polymorphic toxin type 50 domain-containing protein n=1 Tax=Haloimpatiens sp. FM7315 TaxID=3298609 RepID=UPI0035A2FBAC
MTEEEKFVEELYDEANEELKEVYKEQKENRDKLLQEIAMIILTYTVLDGLMSLKRKNKSKAYNKVSKLIKGNMQNQNSTQKHIINKILNNTVKNTFGLYSYNANLKDVKKIVDDNFKGKHFSTRVWENEKAVGERLHKQVKQFLDGKINVNKIKKDIEKTFNTNAYNAKRLTETEVARCSSNAFDRFCIETDVKKVKYNATLCNTCDKCMADHNKVFDFKDKIELPRHPLCHCFYTIEDEKNNKPKVIEEKTVLKSSKDGIINNKDDLVNKTQNVINDIKNGEYPLKILEGKQGKHIIGHNNYIEGRSYLTISLEEIQELVNKYAGTGEIRFNSNDEWDKKEIIKVDRDIGVNVNNKNGEKTSTNRFKIHYSNKGTHIVPMRRE